MARKLRIQFPGAIYHLISRGDRREEIFHDDFDRESFLQTLADCCAKAAWQVHAFCLMPNHFHLVVETPQPNLVAGMKWFLGTYTARFNRRHKLSGHVFAGRYKSLLVGGEGGYLGTVCDYVHLNPVRARILPPDRPIRDYRWSSFACLIASPAHRPPWIRIDRVFGGCGLHDDTPESRRAFEDRLELRRRSESDEMFKSVRNGWCFGSEEFRQEMLTRIEGDAKQYHFGSELQEAAESKADRIVEEELRRVVWTEAELLRRRKGDPQKIAIARRLRAETTMTLQWISARLSMGTKTHLSHLLYWQTQEERGRGKKVRLTHQVSNASNSRKQRRPKESTAIDGVNPSTPKSEPNHAGSPEAADPVQNTRIPLTDPVLFDTSFD